MEINNSCRTHFTTLSTFAVSKVDNENNVWLVCFMLRRGEVDEEAGGSTWQICSLPTLESDDLLQEPRLEISRATLPTA